MSTATTTYRQPIPRWIAQALTGLLIIYCYYQGLHKYLSFADYSFWLGHTPFIKKAPKLFAWGIPGFYLAIALLLIIKKTKTAALWALITGETLFVAWVLYVRTCTPYLFWPWHVFWGGKLNWLYKFLEALTAAWLAATLLYLQHRSSKNEKTDLYINTIGSP